MTKMNQGFSVTFDKIQPYKEKSTSVQLTQMDNFINDLKFSVRVESIQKVLKMDKSFT